MKKKQAFSLEKGSEPFCRLKACFFLESMTKELRSKKFFFAVSFHILLHSNVRENISILYENLRMNGLKRRKENGL